jgi:thiol-disulfide isomerase/thioredoxin
MAGKRVGNPLGVALVATVLAGLLTALVLSLVLEDDETPETAPAVLTLAPAPGDGTVPQTDLAGQAAPGFSYEPLDGGDEVDFDSFRAGQPAVINFFAQWCAPCVREMPDFEAAFGDYGDAVAFLGLSYNESAADARALVDQTGVTYATGRDPAGDILARFGGIGMPTTVFITADGTIATTHTGAIAPAELRDELDGLLG